jgi:phage terminase Nu1 subunit (DNA packaging protein)
MTKRINNLNGTVVTAKVMGDLIGVSDRRIRQMADEGILPKLENGSYDLVDAVRTYIRFLKLNNETDSSSTKASYEEEKMLHERAKRQKAELLLAEMRGQVHDADTVEKVMEEMLTNLKTKILAIPPTVAPMLIGMSDIAEIQDLIEKQVYFALNELKDYDPEMFKNDKLIDAEILDEVESLEK